MEPKKPKKNTVWIVVQGEMYEGYSILAGFSNKSDAEKYASKGRLQGLTSIDYIEIVDVVLNETLDAI